MIHTSRQLKALVRNMSKGDSTQALIIIRNYIMERFLERISLSKYKNNFILKGGMLVSAMVGLDTRSTMDIDTTIKNLPLSIESVEEILKEIISISINDGVTFTIKDISKIMDEAEYGGVRANLDAMLETIRTPLKIDISTDDVITPQEVLYSFKLMFEERTISIWAYNLETVLAEKLETVITRGTANTRLRDSSAIVKDSATILKEIKDSEAMRGLWKSYQKKFSYAEDISWDMVMQAVQNLCNI